MSQSPNPKNRILQIFSILLGITIAVWLLRGFGILAFIPGGIIWLLVLLCIITGILIRLQTTWWRF